MTERKYGREDVDYETFYGAAMKALAKNYPRSELERRLNVNKVKAPREAAASVRLRHSHKTANSMRAAYAEAVSGATGEERFDLNGAIEIYELFPEHTKDAKS